MMKFQKKCRGAVVLCIVLLLMITAMLPMGASAATERKRVLVGGVPFGVRFFTDGILVVGYCDVTSGGGTKNPAREAGICAGDCMIKINERELKTASDFSAAVEENGARPLTVVYRRGEEERTATITPVACDEDGRLRLGLWVRDSGAGIGTVTYITEDGNCFGGLGHGICDGESGSLIPMARGSVMGVRIGGITKGAVGAPGELRGHFSAGKIGSLLKNTECGVFGVLAECPQLPATQAVPIATREEVHNGAATLWCTLDDNVPREYRVELSMINRAATGNKCFTVKVTDPALLEKTGGIVQGMSGSPIIQDGKLVGAVTHVLINDPTTGYGIFIENMLGQMGDMAG